jgi:hypothetical protein
VKKSVLKDKTKVGKNTTVSSADSSSGTNGTLKDGSFRHNEDEIQRSNYGNGGMREAIDSRLPFTQQKESAYQKNVLDAIRNNTKEAMQSRGVNETGAQLKSGAEASNPGMEIPNLITSYHNFQVSCYAY